MTPKVGVIILIYELVYSKVRHRLKWIQTLFQGWIKMTRTKQIYKMNHHVVRTNILNVKDKYFASDKSEKAEILKSLEECTHRDRKHLIKVLNESKSGWSNVAQSKIGRPLSYNKEELLPHVRRLWLNMERISPWRMKAGLKVPINTLDSKITLKEFFEHVRKTKISIADGDEENQKRAA
jgi:hypothetical protein